MSKLYRLGLALAGCVALATPAWGQTSRDPIVHAEEIQQISPHVSVIPDDSVPGVPNVGIVVGSRAALVIDTGLGPCNGAIVLKAAQQKAPGRALYLVTTHVHPEHDLGAQAFPPDAKLIRSKDQVQEIAEVGQTVAEAFRRRSSVMADLLKGAEFRMADIVFDQSYSLDLGGVTVRLLAMGPNHTPGDTAMFVLPDEVLFDGDIAMQRLPIFASPLSSAKHWLASIDRLEALHPTRIVPSHGPMGDGSEFLDKNRAFITAVRDRALELRAQGKGQEEALEAVAEEFRDRYPDRARIGDVVKSAYAEP